MDCRNKGCKIMGENICVHDSLTKKVPVDQFLKFFRCVLVSLYEVVSVRPSDGRMDGRSVTRFLNAKNEPFSL